MNSTSNEHRFGVCITTTMRQHVSCVYESCTIFGRKKKSNSVS